MTCLLISLVGLLFSEGKQAVWIWGREEMGAEKLGENGGETAIV